MNAPTKPAPATPATTHAHTGVERAGGVVGPTVTRGSGVVVARLAVVRVGAELAVLRAGVVLVEGVVAAEFVDEVCAVLAPFVVVVVFAVFVAVAVVEAVAVVLAAVVAVAASGRPKRDESTLSVYVVASVAAS